ncbi:MAG TPA: hypothetical protein VNH38_06705 [Candidatus Dormibacteraeota bacterium]|nr:hypothetical protein [Candidatus Dormibacteraeota bacterium]
MPDREQSVRAGEVRIRPTDAHRRRASVGAGAGIGVVLVPIGLLVGVFTHTWGVLLIGVFATAMASVASYIGQGHNEVFVGPRGIRRVARNCDLIASWRSLQGVGVKVPGNRIVVFTVSTTGVEVERLTKRHSNASEAVERHPPEGFEFRFDRAAADALVTAIAERRPDLQGLADWASVSRPT